MAEATIKVLDNGPYIVTGNADLVDSQGNSFEKKDQLALCRCGNSTNKPFCTGACQEKGFNSTVKAK